MNEHGTIRTFRAGCTCVPCREAQRRVTSHNRSKAKRHAERTSRDGRPFHPRAPHGTTTGYGYWGCRCDQCTTTTVTAALDRRAERRHR